MRRLLATELVGREDELRALRELSERARSGRGALVVVVGEAGSGKSRLVGELGASLLAAGRPVLVGRGLEGSGDPYRPIIEALIGHGDAPVADEPALAMLSSRAADRMSGETSGVVLADELLTALGRVGPGCLLVVDDVHWSEPDTIGLLAEMATLIERHPVLVVATGRPGEPLADTLIARVERIRPGSVLPLARLDAHLVEAMVGSCLGSPPPEDVLAFVDGRSEGVPLFVEELLAGLVSTGALVEGADGWTSVSRITPVVPSSLGASVRRRFAQLESEPRAVVEAGAVLGREFDWRLLGPMTGLTDDAVTAGLEAAVRLQLLEADVGGCRFRHALVHEALLAEIVPWRAAELAERALAEIVREGDGSVPDRRRDLATSLSIACGDLQMSARMLVAAARDALDRGALATAAATIDRADGLEIDGDLRDDVDETAVTIHALSGRIDLALERGRAVLDRLARRPSTEARRIRLLLALARADLAAGEWGSARRHVAAAHVLVDESDPRTLASVLALDAHVALNERRLHDATIAAGAAAEAAARAGVAEVRCEALEVLGRAARFVDPVEAAARFEEAVAVATAHGLGGWRLRAMTELAIDAVFHRTDDRLLWEARELAVSAGARVTVAVIDLHLAGHLLVSGRRERGLEIATRCVDDCRRYRLSMLPIALLHVAAGHALGGDGAAAEAIIAEVEVLGRPDPDVEAAIWGWVRAELAFVTGDDEGMLACLDRAMEPLRGRDGTVPFPFRAMWPLLRTLVGNGATARAEVRASHAVSVLAQTWPLDVADAVDLGRRGRAAEADAVYAAAERRLPEGEWHAWHRHRVRLLAAPAALHDGWGDPVRWLREAEVFFDERGYPRVAARCRRTMRDAGIAVGRRGRGESPVPEALRARGVTSREVDVLRLVGERASNREIAAALHLSVRTVEKHVASLLLKTDSDARRALIELARRTVVDVQPA